jgi:virulence factor
MMKVGIVGPGNIAQKAYLPVFAQMQDNYEFFVCSRDLGKGKGIAAQFGINNAVAGVDALVKAGCEAAFVHVSTHAHFETAKALLMAGVHVCMDKPVSQSLEETRELLRIAGDKGLIFMSGFNRRFAPLTDRLKALPDKNLMFISKNRVFGANDARRVIYDEFIHPLDTAVYLLDDEILNFESSITLNNDGLLIRAVVRIESACTTAVVSTNRQSGANAEAYEVQTPHKTSRVENLAELTTLTKDVSTVETFGDWVSTLEKRGFAPMIQAFLGKASGGNVDIKQQNVLLTHELCERMLEGR